MKPTVKDTDRILHEAQPLLRTGLLCILFAAIWALLSAPAALHAHGGGRPQLSGAEAGSYRLYAWTTPDPWRVGEVHVDVAVAMPIEHNAEMPVVDALVAVRVEHLETGEVLDLVATPLEYLNSFYYETDFQLPQEGRWQVDISVEGEEGSGAAGFEIEAEPPRTVNWLLVLGGSGTLLLAIVLWAIWSRPNAPAQTVPNRRTRRTT